MDGTCPSCATHIEKLTPEILSEKDGATCDCPYCDTLLIIKEGRLQEFHPWLHEQDSRWPKDGKDTDYIAVE